MKNWLQVFINQNFQCNHQWKEMSLESSRERHHLPSVKINFDYTVYMIYSVCPRCGKQKKEKKMILDIPKGEN